MGLCNYISYQDNFLEKLTAKNITRKKKNQHKYKKIYHSHDIIHGQIFLKVFIDRSTPTLPIHYHAFMVPSYLAFKGLLGLLSH